MDDYRKILKQVGIALIVVGVLDIAYMIYCIAHQQSYSSSLNIFAVIAGVFLWRGSLQAVRIVTWFSAFMLAGFTSAWLTFPFVEPAGLWAAEFREHPVRFAVAVAIGIAAIALAFWVYRKLREIPVMEARKAAGQSASPPRSAFVSGVGLTALLFAALFFTTNGASAKRAVAMAKSSCGSGFHYQVSSMNWSNRHVSAVLWAYNRQEIRQVRVEWDQ